MIRSSFLTSILLCAVIFVACSGKTTDAQKPSTQTTIATPTTEDTLPSNQNQKADAPPEAQKVAIPKHEPCVVPLTTNPIPKDKQRPLVVTYETYQPDVLVTIMAYTEHDTENQRSYPLDLEYDCDMDGVYEEQLDSQSDEKELGCEFEEPGIYQIAIRGDIPRLDLDFNSDNTEDYDTDQYNLISIDQWGDIRWKDMTDLLSYHNKYNPKTKKPNYPTLKAKDAPDLRDVCSMENMFSGNAEFNTPIGHWDVTHVEDMNGMFRGCIKFNQDISSWNVSNVINMIDMFKDCTSFNQDISKWNVSNVKGMSHMFENSSSFNQDITPWDITSLQVVFDMFKSNDQNVTICSKCESFRKKVLEKSSRLGPDDVELSFENKNSFEVLFK